jgi:asparagine synthase (glutamine-hydrolysing)
MLRRANIRGQDHDAPKTHGISFLRSSMCGIAGIIRWGNLPVVEPEIAAMAAALEHRGPDQEGMFVEGGVGIGMRRLSIIDLSPLGRQPMANEDGQIQVVYNGEIYNFRELRTLLEREGHTFRSTTDTEVLVHGYEHFGAVELCKRLEGMFAFALLDRRARRLVLGRDRFGIKPLYLRRGPQQLSFASEVRAFSHDGLGRPAVNPAFVSSYLAVGYVASPATAFRDVVKLPPSTVIQIDLISGAQQQTKYYELSPENIDRAADAELVDALRERLDGAIQRHLISDVPMGIFLSGGIDSSAIATFANRQSPRPLASFSMGFASSDRGDEISFAARVADTIGSPNTRFELAPHALGDLDRIVACLEEPLSDSAVLPLWHLCAGTGAHVKVALSGEGGDEALGGYGRYFWAGIADQLSHSAFGWPQVVSRLSHLAPAKTLGPLNLIRRAGKLAHSMDLSPSLRYMSWFEIFTPDEQKDLCGAEATEPSARVEQLFTQASDMALDDVQRLQYVDFHTTLLDNLLMKADKLSMAHSLEVRVPLLDRRLVEFGLALPPRAKAGLRRSKELLRELLRADLPLAITDRPKRGFEIPVDTWFRDESMAGLRRQLVSGALVKVLGLSAPAIAKVIDLHVAGEDLGRKMFSLATLEFWAARFC